MKSHKKFTVLPREYQQDAREFSFDGQHVSHDLSDDNFLAHSNDRTTLYSEIEDTTASVDSMNIGSQPSRSVLKLNNLSSASFLRPSGGRKQKVIWGDQYHWITFGHDQDK